ncbi:MAG: ATP-dependent Clp protease proteolytic subunit [Methanogenium sp.]|jgi:ATP-dependent Clp protease protease subunit
MQQPEEEKNKKILEENLKLRIEDKKKGIFFINSIFDDTLLEFLFFDIKKAIEDITIKEIFIYINSNGGDTTTLFPLYDLIKKSDKTINTIVLGKAYSAGAIILLSGTNRFAYKNSEILLHEVSTEIPNSKSTQIFEFSKNIVKINKTLKKIVKENTKMTSKEIETYFNSNKDIFIDSSKALKYGIIDKII